MLWLLLACEEPGAPAWAVNYATVVPGATGMAAAHQWAFFDRGWARDRAPEHFTCGALQEVTGSVVGSLDDCPGCLVTYALRHELTASDCTDSLTEDPGLVAIATFAIGDLPEELAPHSPHPDAWGWYISLDGSAALPHGFAWHAALDQGDAAPSGWLTGEPYTLWPAYTWEL